MAFLHDKKIRTLIIIMSVLVAVGLLITRVYYRSVNQASDPRVVDARSLYAEYNILAKGNDFDGIFSLLDSIESIYRTWPHYANSYETGVLYNNRAAALLIMAMHKDSLVIRSGFFSKMSSDTLLERAEKAIQTSIGIYENWLAVYGDKSEEDLRAQLQGNFLIGLEDYPPRQIAKFQASRLREWLDAQAEVPRRLSVSYTNRGIIFRNRGDYEEAVLQYKKAMDLWDRNLVAENNLNILMGRPMKKRNFIQKLFPPPKGE